MRNWLGELDGKRSGLVPPENNPARPAPTGPKRPHIFDEEERYGSENYSSEDYSNMTSDRARCIWKVYQKMNRKRKRENGLKRRMRMKRRVKRYEERMKKNVDIV
ncbi:hypothetical protein PRIPAC_85327 [Pristionchus pacificus]|uniref:Uncharacterized protein n=1 Tax=Pristionchus pacificus TaxID=54126 RepID=A0A2A6BM17_PRIPA|nr:hypothetical protein PRIPAC_85327 [Pristionchus pacificus]|eukprot:PDM66898.1 hypothetical protein PRIPAC_48315 [Pristionchus pacificus]